MIAMQNAEFRHQIQFTSQELADIVALAHDAAEQQKLSESDIPDEIKSLMEGDKDSLRAHASAPPRAISSACAPWWAAPAPVAPT